MKIPKGTSIEYVEKMIVAAKKTLQEYVDKKHRGRTTDCSFCILTNGGSTFNDCINCYWEWFYGKKCYSWLYCSKRYEGMDFSSSTRCSITLHNYRIKMLQKHIPMMEDWVKKQKELTNDK